MNALYANSKGEVRDPLDGVGDLLTRRVRFVGDARMRIRQDYLRNSLRFFRFSAQYAEGAFDRAGVHAAIGERLGLQRLSRERIRSELLRHPRCAADGRRHRDHGRKRPSPSYPWRRRPARALQQGLPHRGVARADARSDFLSRLAVEPAMRALSLIGRGRGRFAWLPLADGWTHGA